MEKISTFVLFLALPFHSLLSQNEEMNVIDRQHAIASSLAFTPSVFLNEKMTLFYISGSLSYYPKPQISIRGDNAFSLREFNSDGNVKMRYHSVFFGACYHFTKNGPMDPFIGFQPGYSYLERNQVSNLPAQSSIREAIPNASVVLGLNFYVNRYFHLFTNIRYVYGQPARNITQGAGLHEIRFSFGLSPNFARWQKR